MLVLAPDSSNKIYSRWHGPCTISQGREPYSYVVDMGDGSRRHLHANGIHKFIVRTHLVGIIKEDDDEFEEVSFGPTAKNEPLCLPSQKIDTECLTHLDNAQRTELLHVLYQFPQCFSKVKYTVPDGFPMQNIDEVKLEVGNSTLSVYSTPSRGTGR